MLGRHWFLSSILCCLMGAHNLFASEENIVDTIETILSDLEPLLKSDLVREDRIRKSTEVVFRFNKAVSYSVVKVQAEPFIGELNETAAWVILRKVNDQYYLPRYDRADELPAEVSYLLFQLDPLHLQEKSTSPFVRASYQNSDWLRPNAVTPSSYEKIRNSSAMQMSQLKKPLRKSLDVRCEGRLVIDSDGTRHFDRAKMIPYKGLWMMYLYGSPEEIACQRGGLVSDIILETSFPIYANRIDRAIEQSPLVRTAPFLVDLLKLYIDNEYFSTLEKNLTPEDHRKAIAFAKGANVSLEHVYKAVLLPDVGQFLLAQSYSAMAKVIGAFGALPGLGCSTFVVPPEQSENGQLIGRNLDYDGGGYFDRFTTVEYLHPSSDSEKQTYTSITTLGGPFGALTTHNESGITLTLHQLLVDQVSLKGRPILSLTEEISSRARTIDEALAILRANRTSSTWRLILTSLEENRSVNVDLSPLGVFVTPLEKLGNAVTNTAINPAMQKDEFALDFSFYADTRYRHMVLGTRLKNFSAATVQDAIDLISSHESFDVYQKSWKDKSPRNTIGKRSNVQSLVLAPSDGLVYVAVPPMPFARPLEGSYIPLPISSKEWRANPDYLLLPSLKRRKAFNPDFVKANAYFRKAVIPLTEEGRFEEGVRLIEEAAKLQPDEAAYPLTAAWTEFLVYWRSEDPKVRAEALERAYEFLNRAEDLELENYHENLIWLFKARYFDLKNDREAAKKYLFRVKRNISKQLAAAADRQEKFGYSRSQLRSLVIDYLNVDLHQF